MNYPVSSTSLGMPPLPVSPLLLFLILGIPMAASTALWVYRQTRRTSLALAFAALALLGTAQLIHYFPQGVDDSFISYRYSENLAAGRGLCFNPGERVEGFSNPLWVVVMAGAAAVGINRDASDWALPLAAKLISALCHAITIVWIVRWIRRSKGSWLALCAGLSWMICAGPNALWAITGMETSLHALLLVWAVTAWSDFDQNRHLPARPVSLGIALMLLVFSRPECMLLSAAMIGLWAYADFRAAHRLSRAWCLCALLLAVTVTGLTVFRWIYFGDILPNTFYAKATGGLWFQARHGFQYLATAFCVSGGVLWFLALWPRRPAESWNLAPLTLTAAQTIVILAVGGDWMMGYRFWAPIIPLGAIGLARFVHRHETQITSIFHGQKFGLLPLVIVFLALLQVVAFDRILYMQTDVFVSGFRKLDLFPSAAHYDVARQLKQVAKPDELVALGEAGMIPYLSKVKTLDCFGLLDRQIAALPGMMHGKASGNDILHRNPDYILLGPMAVPLDSLALQCENTFAYQLLRSREFAATYREMYRNPQFLLFQRVDPIPKTD